MFETFSILLHWIQDPAFDIALLTFCMVVMKDAFEDHEPKSQPKEDHNFQTQKSEDPE